MLCCLFTMWQVRTLKQASKGTAGLNENTNNHYTIENQAINYRNAYLCFQRAKID